jgi:hypothetical protein
MNGYWRANIDGAEVAKGDSPDEAHASAVSKGHDPNAIVLEYVYEAARVGLSFIQ